MQRFKQPNMDLHPDGEWVRYADHVEAMKRISGASPASDMGQDSIEPDCPHDTCDPAACRCTSPAALTDEQIFAAQEQAGLPNHPHGGSQEVLHFARLIERCVIAASPANPAPAALTDDALIDAANARADLYEGDDRPCIKTDVMNAFYAGAEFAKRAAPADQAEISEDERLRGMVAAAVALDNHEDARDAKRYRWLRDSDRLGDDELDGQIVTGAAGAEELLWGERMDNAIDAAMSKEKSDE